MVAGFVSVGEEFSALPAHAGLPSNRWRRLKPAATKNNSLNATRCQCQPDESLDVIGRQQILGKMPGILEISQGVRGAPN